MSDSVEFISTIEPPILSGNRVTLVFATDADAFVFLETLDALNRGEMGLRIGTAKWLEDEEDEDELQSS